MWPGGDGERDEGGERDRHDAVTGARGARLRWDAATVTHNVTDTGDAAWRRPAMTFSPMMSVAGADEVEPRDDPGASWPHQSYL